MRFGKSGCKVILYATLVALLGCGKGGAKPDLESQPDSSATKSAEGWQWYEDAAIRFQHPMERKVVPLPEDPKGYFVMEPGDIDGLPGPESITIFPANDPKTEGLALREIAVGHVRNAAREHMQLIGNLSNILLRDGHCVSYRLEGSNVGGCLTQEGNAPVCRSLSLRSECETGKKKRFKIDSIAEAYPEAGKPSARAREQIKVFERVVKSIEFK